MGWRGAGHLPSLSRGDLGQLREPLSRSQYPLWENQGWSPGAPWLPLGSLNVLDCAWLISTVSVLSPQLREI